MKNGKFSFFDRLISFRYAFNGFRILFKEEHNSRIHLAVAAIVVTAGFLLGISIYEWLAVVLSIGFVLSMEAINSAIENIADFVSPQRDDQIKRIKDLSAAAVLLASMTAITVGLVVFAPKIWDVF